jgi:hypothetical protein
MARFSKEFETNLIFDIIDKFGGDEKPLLKNKLDYLVKYSKRRIMKNLQDFVDQMDMI